MNKFKYLKQAKIYLNSKKCNESTTTFTYGNVTIFVFGAVPAFPYSAFNCFIATNFATFYGRRFCYVSPDWSK